VGGEILPAVLEQLTFDGTCVIFGATAGSNITFNASKFYGKGGLSLYGFILFHELRKQPAAVGLARLVKLVADGALVPHLDVEVFWNEIAKVARCTPYSTQGSKHERISNSDSGRYRWINTH
jgi:NADPH:quinone reductase